LHTEFETFRGTAAGRMCDERGGGKLDDRLQQEWTWGDDMAEGRGSHDCY